MVLKSKGIGSCGMQVISRELIPHVYEGRRGNKAVKKTVARIEKVLEKMAAKK